MGRVGHSLPRSRYQGRYATLLPRVSAGDPLRDDPNNGYHYHWLGFFKLSTAV